MGRVFIASLVVLLALGWQYATVSVNYDGNWTALFCTAGRRPVPPALAGERVYTFEDSEGFDAQFYHYIAHEPLPGEMAPYIEAARMRYRRILMPATAWLLSLGRQDAIDFAYLAAGYLFLVLGMLWTGRYAARLGLSERWTLIFAAAPASIVFVDRLTVDHALAALTAAFALHAVRRPSWKLWVILALVPLAREIGILLTVAYCLYCLIWREWKLAGVFAASAVPFGLWNLFLTRVTPPAPYETPVAPLSRLVHWLTHAQPYPPDVPLRTLVEAGDVLALLGAVAGMVLAGVLVVRRRSDPAALAAAGFALLAIFVQRDDVWQTPYNYGRIFSPMFLLVALGWMPVNRWLGVLPLALITPRLLMQYGRQAQGIFDCLR